MATSQEIITIASRPLFRERVNYFMLKAAYAYASGASPTVNELRFAKGVVNATLDVGRYALSVLASSPSIVPQGCGIDGQEITDLDLENAVNAIAANTGKALA